MPKNAQARRESTLSQLALEYKDALLYTGELKRAIDSFTGGIPEGSPVRYLRMGPGEAVIDYLTRAGKPKTIQELVDELDAGGIVFGGIKSPLEIVTKVVSGYIQYHRLRWVNKSRTLVGLPEKTRK